MVKLVQFAFNTANVVPAVILLDDVVPIGEEGPEHQIIKDQVFNRGNSLGFKVVVDVRAGC